MRFIKENIESEWAYVGAGDSNYHDMQSIDNLSCDTDIYVGSKNKAVLAKQVLALNEFVGNYNSYQREFYRLFEMYLTDSERARKDKILGSILNLEVLDVPVNNVNYDVAAICSIDYKKMVFITNSIALRIEIKNGKIESARRTNSDDSTNENRNYAF